MNFENMTNKEIRSIRNKLAIERQKNKKVVSDREYKHLIRKREKQVSQAKMQIYVFGYIFAIFAGIYMGDNSYHFSMNLFVLTNLMILIYIVICYLVIPRFTNNRFLTYRIRYLIPGALYFIGQTILIIPVGEFGGTNVTIPLIPIVIYIFIGIPIVMIQNWLEKRVYEEREKEVFQKFSWNDWYSEKIFEYEHMGNEEVNEEIEKDLIMDKQIRACNQELKARKLEARLTDGRE